MTTWESVGAHGQVGRLEGRHHRDPHGQADELLGVEVFALELNLLARGQANHEFALLAAHKQAQVSGAENIALLFRPGFVGLGGSALFRVVKGIFHLP